jgi:DNA invertase Pin-like site-specific DNA recombinase
MWPSFKQNSRTEERDVIAIKGYARVGTDGQPLEAQQAAIREAGAGQVFAEKQSGANIELH